jgi:ParB family chromosome partitioning protein
MRKPSFKDRALMPVAAEPAGDTAHSKNDLANPKSGPGAMVAYISQNSEALIKNEQLEADLAKAKFGLAEFDGATPTRRLDPTIIVRSRWANRREESFADKEFAKLKDEILSAGGNVQPIKVRPIKAQAGKPEQYEIVFGHRRHQACLELGLLVLAMVEEVNDKTLFVEMDRENRQRKDLRPIEKGMMYNKALVEGLFPSIRKLAESLGVDISGLAREIALAKLPGDVLKAFENPLDIQLRWSSDLGKALEANPDLVLATAKRLQGETPRLGAKKVFEELTKTSVGSTHTPKTKIKISGVNGKTASIVLDVDSKSAVINIENIDPSRVDELQKIIQQFIS